MIATLTAVPEEVVGKLLLLRNRGPGGASFCVVFWVAHREPGHRIWQRD